MRWNRLGLTSPLGIIALCICVAACSSPEGGGPTTPPVVDTPEISVMLDTTDITVGGSVSIGSTVVGTPKDVKFTIYNTGTADLSLTGTPLVAVGGADAGSFTISVFPAATVGLGGGSQDFHVLFNPGSAGSKSITVTIANNDVDEGTFAFTVQGDATAAPEPEINVNNPSGTPIASGSGSYTFAPTLVGSTTNAVFTIQNLGSASLTLGGTPRVVIGGADAAMFVVSPQPSSPVAASGSTTFTVAFTPGSAGARSATVSIANNDTSANTVANHVRSILARTGATNRTEAVRLARGMNEID